MHAARLNLPCIALIRRYLMNSNYQSLACTTNLIVYLCVATKTNKVSR